MDRRKRRRREHAPMEHFCAAFCAGLGRFGSKNRRKSAIFPFRFPRAEIQIEGLGEDPGNNGNGTMS